MCEIFFEAVKSSKAKIPDYLSIIEDFVGVTSGIRTHDIQNHNLTL